MIRIYSAADFPQGSPAWHEARRGVPTASNFNRILTPKTCKFSSQANKYINELIGDVVNLSPTWFSENAMNKPPNAAMINGIATEPEARRWYEMESELDVQQVGFVLDAKGRFGCSPDGLIGEEGLLELKCPLLKTQVGYLRDGVLPNNYRCQVHGQLIVTGRMWVDFASYAVGLPPLLVRVYPDKFTELLRAALDVFWGRYMEMIALLKSVKAEKVDSFVH